MCPNDFDRLDRSIDSIERLASMLRYWLLTSESLTRTNPVDLENQILVALDLADAAHKNLDQLTPQHKR